MKIKINKKESFSVDVKRFYLPIEISATCPHCGEEVYRDFDSDYLSYPDFNVPYEITFYHNDLAKSGQEHEWKEEVIFGITCKEVKKEDDA